MNNINGFKKSVFFFILIIVTNTFFGQIGNVPVQSLPQFPGPLAIDGFLERQGTAGDWLPGPGGGTNCIISPTGMPLVPFCYVYKDKFNSSEDEIFSKGSFQDDPNTMKWTFRKATSKTDLNNILYYVAIDPANNNLWIIIAADRRSTGKNSTIDFEFLQNQVLMTGDLNSGTDRGFYSAGPDGGRTVKDLLISVTFQNTSGSSATVQFFQWLPPFGYFPISAQAFVATNNVPVNVPFGAFGSTEYPAYTFIETAISLAVFGSQTPTSPTIWVKSRSNDNLDDFYPPIQLSQTFGFKINATYSFYDLYTAQLNADISPNNPDDYNFHWGPIGATNGSFFNPSVTGSLNNYDIPDPIFSADTNYNCISYVYKLTVSAKSNPGVVVAQTYLVINSPCKIGKPINPDQMNQGSTLLEETPGADNINVFPNPARGSSAITLSGDNSPKDIKLIDINGVVIQQWSGINGNLKLKNVPKGLYLLRISSKKTGKTTTKKLVIQN